MIIDKGSEVFSRINHNNNGNPHKQYIGNTLSTSIKNAINISLDAKEKSVYFFKAMTIKTDKTVDISKFIGIFDVILDCDRGSCTTGTILASIKYYDMNQRLKLQSNLKHNVYAIINKEGNNNIYDIYITVPSSYTRCVVIPKYTFIKNATCEYNDLGLLDVELPEQGTVKTFNSYDNLRISTTKNSGTDRTTYAKICEFNTLIDNTKVKGHIKLRRISDSLDNTGNIDIAYMYTYKDDIYNTALRAKVIESNNIDYNDIIYVTNAGIITVYALLRQPGDFYIMDITGESEDSLEDTNGDITQYLTVFTNKDSEEIEAADIDDAIHLVPNPTTMIMKDEVTGILYKLVLKNGVLKAEQL